MTLSIELHQNQSTKTWVAVLVKPEICESVENGVITKERGRVYAEERRNSIEESFEDAKKLLRDYLSFDPKAAFDRDGF